MRMNNVAPSMSLPYFNQHFANRAFVAAFLRICPVVDKVPTFL